jgi:hypothetical protein
MTKSIKVTITDDTGTVLDTYEIDLAKLEAVARRGGALNLTRRLMDDVSEVSSKVTHEIRAALERRAKPGPESPRTKLRNFMSRGK